ncbi:MAG: 16S rRNA (guanine(527)-N(7))-methyltransferase RsmG [Clostridiales bacterium]|nr:16S rRNA (guanine(527)-N(7))-methyltransferase RsmG [Clostridiales bacterium]
MQELIEDGLREMGLSPASGAALARYGQLLLKQNQVMNLTAITDPTAVARLHMLDCAALLNAADFTEKSVLDVGTGAGFPGLVLKLCQPDLRLTLLDSLDKRVQWLAQTAPALGAEDVVCLHGRAEELALQGEHREQYDIVTSRAVADLRVLAELCLPFLRVGGVFLAMKGRDCGLEVDRAGRAITLLGGRLQTAYTYQIPGKDVTHKVIRVEKVRPTPQRYPRRFAKIKKDPL